MVERFTHTIPLTGGTCGVVDTAVVFAFVEAAGAGAAATGAGLGAALAAGALDPAPTVTIDVILSIVLFGTPAFARSATDA